MNKILIIDDNPTSLKILMDYLKDHNFDLYFSTNGRDGIDIARRCQPDIILLDINMPLFDGFEVCGELKADTDTADIPIIFLTAYTTIETKVAGFAAGGTDYIVKPFVKEEVLARIYAHLKNFNAVREIELDSERSSSEINKLYRREALSDRLYSEAVTLFNENLSHPLTIIEVAHRVGTNQNRLNDIFRAKLDMTASEYYQKLRLEYGKTLLKGADVQVKQISELCGYPNQGDFTRAFKNRYGMTPREYRKSEKGASSNDE